MELVIVTLNIIVEHLTSYQDGANNWATPLI